MRTSIFGLFLLLILVAPFETEARYRGDIAGWIPWWTPEDELEDVTRRLDDTDFIYPFIYEIEDGEIVAKADLKDDAWEDLLEEADDERVEVYPTIAWFDGAEIHTTLSDRRKRQALVDDIEDLVDDNDFDGINIDFEQKQARTINYFSDFLEELDDALGRDDLTCTIEARTPPEDLYARGQMPDNIEYANDYKAMNRYCDWVEIMAYDQQRADVALNNERRGVPYAPVADKDWVEKVIELALEDIDEDKILLGIPTYGRAWDVTVAPNWYRDYERVATLNQPRILELSEKYDAPIGRSDGGEAVISYFPDTSPYQVFNQLPTIPGTPKGFEAAGKALFIANYLGIEIPVRFVTWSDAEAAEDKIDLAEEYDLRGVVFFKWDGEEDRKIWRLF